MKVSYKIAGGTTGWQVLFDESTGTAGLAVFNPQFSAVLQAEPLAFSDAEFRELRGNGKCTLPLAVNLTYATRAAALASVATLRELTFKNKLHLKVEEGGTVQYYPNATCPNYAGNLLGSAVLHTFPFITDEITTEEPS